MRKSVAIFVLGMFLFASIVFGEEKKEQVQGEKKSGLLDTICIFPQQDRPEVKEHYLQLDIWPFGFESVKNEKDLLILNNRSLVGLQGSAGGISYTIQGGGNNTVSVQQGQR
ncbi:MAG: hypothetical protein V1645_01335 [archaeon]